MRTQTFLIRCEYPDGDRIPTQEFVENIQEYFTANIMDGERGRLVVKPVYQPKEEGLVEEETTSDKVIEEAKTYLDSIKDDWICPDGYIFKDENGNVINATKIVLEKKKKEYPKTYEECAKELGYSQVMPKDHILGYRGTLLSTFQQLLICRDAYWKIAGEEMGLGETWKPKLDNNEKIYYIHNVSGKVYECEGVEIENQNFAFPTEEMRDAFYDNFKELMDSCKELL